MPEVTSVVRASDPTPLLPIMAFPAASEAAVVAAAEQVCDWPGTIELARLHNVLGLLAQRLVAVRPASVPESVIEDLVTERRLMNRWTVLRGGQLLALAEALEDEGIPMLSVKGPALSQDLYGDPSLRAFGDLDIVVRRADVDDARRVLLANGFRDALRFNDRIIGRARWESEISLVGIRGEPEVDLHWQLMVGSSPRTIQTDRLLTGARDLPLLGGSVRAPGAADQLLLSVLHSARHRWQTLELRLAVAVQVDRVTAGEWPAICATARELGCLRRLVVGVAHACRPFAVPVPGELHRLLRADRVAPGYAAHLDGVAARPAEAARGAAFAADFSDLVWDGLSEDDLADTVRHLLARALLPSREDWAAMAVPEPLAVLYPVLRPARLARKYAAAVFAPTGHITPGRRVRRTFR